MSRRFLMLQGPHGPFFRSLARALRRADVEVDRVLFNRGDRLFWKGPARTWSGPFDGWPAWLEALLRRRAITDLVLYGDQKPIHAASIPVARARGVTVHVFEEGYLRPWWITYERGGSNGNSRLTDISDAAIAAAVAQPGYPLTAPEGWGAMYRHMLYGAIYHGAVLTGGARLPAHRGVSIAQEAWLHFARLAGLPRQAVQRRFATRALRRATQPYHMVLLQLDHDANFRHHGPFPSTPAFIEAVIRGFATGAPPHHRLVFKAHPLEDGRTPLAPAIRESARAFGAEARVDFIPGGKLARLLDGAASVVTVNSTAAQQALWRGLPVKAFGEAVYARPDFVSTQNLPEFFAGPVPPDRQRYDAFRRFLLETSQFPGSFYTAGGRRQVCRKVVDYMLSEDDPYALRLATPGAAQPQHLSVVNGLAGAER